MKRFIYSFLLVILTACSTNYFFPELSKEVLVFKNVFYKRLYILPIIAEKDDNGNQICKEGSLYSADFLKSFSTSDTSAIAISNLCGVKFYQDKRKECFLYGYNREELRKLRRAAGFTLEQNDKAIYLVNKDKVNVVPKNKGYNLNGKVWVERYYKDEFCKPDKDILQ